MAFEMSFSWGALWGLGGQCVGLVGQGSSGEALCLCLGVFRVQEC